MSTSASRCFAKYSSKESSLGIIGILEKRDSLLMSTFLARNVSPSTHQKSLLKQLLAVSPSTHQKTSKDWDDVFSKVKREKKKQSFA